MTMIRAGLVILALAVPSGALAQAPELLAQREQAVSDLPDGYPYNVGQAYETTQVPLRDFFSSRLDQNRAEFLDRLSQLRDIIDERDERYSQRFQAQQEALNAALEAATQRSDTQLLANKEQVANALSAAKEAVAKAEVAVEKRFESVNEFRQSLDDLSRLQMPRAEAEALFRTLDEKVAGIIRAQDTTRDQGTGRDDTWALVAAGLALFIALASLWMGYTKQQKATA